MQSSFKSIANSEKYSMCCSLTCHSVSRCNFSWASIDNFLVWNVLALLCKNRSWNEAIVSIKSWFVQDSFSYVRKIFYTACMGDKLGRAESNFALWSATRAGKMELSCPLGTTRRVQQKNFPRTPHNKSFIEQTCSVKMAGYWTSTPSLPINTQKMNSANIQPSWPHTWSITHTYDTHNFLKNVIGMSNMWLVLF